MANPVMLASGILGETGKSLLRVFDGGAGAVVTKSIGSEPRQGHANPAFLEVTGGYINAMGLPNPGLDEYSTEVLTVVAGHAVVVGSVFGRNEHEFADLALRMRELGVAAVELNLSCPHAIGTGMELGTDPDVVASITTAVKSALDIPVFVKLTPNITDITVIARAAAGAGADGVVAINTLKAIAIDHASRRPVLGNVVGGFSGPALKHVGLRMVWDIYNAFHGPRTTGGPTTSIIGVGGIESGQDAAEYILAGASAVQVGSALVEDGPEAPGRIARELGDWMDAQGFTSVDQFTGLAHRNAQRV